MSTEEFDQPEEDQLSGLLSLDFIETSDISLERSRYQTDIRGVEIRISEHDPELIDQIGEINPEQQDIEQLLGEPLSERGTIFLADFNLPTLVESFNLAAISGDRSLALGNCQRLASKIANSERLSGPMVIRQQQVEEPDLDDQISSSWRFSGYGRLEDIGEAALLAKASDPSAFWVTVNLLFADIHLSEPI